MCFQFAHFPCDVWDNIYTLPYYHYQIGSMNYYPLCRIRPLNNGFRCMSFYILIETKQRTLPFGRNYDEVTTPLEIVTFAESRTTLKSSDATKQGIGVYYIGLLYQMIWCDWSARCHVKFVCIFCSISLYDRDCKFVIHTSLVGAVLCVIANCLGRACRAILTHWGRDKMDAISQTTFSSAFSRMKIFDFRLKFH